MKKSILDRLRDTLNSLGGTAVADPAVADPEDADELEKARRPLPPEEPDDKEPDDGDDDNPPSQEDADQDAAPDKPAPPDDDEGDDEGDDDEDDRGGPPDDDEDDEGGDDEDDEDDLKKKILRRSREDPDFFKSLAASPEGREAMKLIEASDAVAYLTQTFAEGWDDLARENKELRRIIKGGLADLASDNEVLAEAVMKSLTMQADMLKSLGEQGDLIKSQGRRDSGKVGHGLGALRPPERFDPLEKAERAPSSGSAPVVLTDEERLATMRRKARLQTALMKSVEEEKLPGDLGGQLLLKCATAEGIVAVETYLRERHEDIYKSLTA